MKLLIKAYSKKNIAELTPKKVLVTPKNKKPYWMTTYARTGEKEHSNKYTNKLLTSIKNANPKGIREAVERGANIDAKNPEGETALTFSMGGANRDKRLTKFLLDHGANTELKGFMGMTPIFDAIHFENFDAVKELVDHGANINVKDKEGEFPLMTAVRVGDIDTIKYLLDHGADLRMRDNQGRRIFDYKWNKEIDKLLNEYKQKFGIV